VNNTNLPPSLHRFQVMADYWSNFRSLGVIPYEYLDKLYCQETRMIFLPETEDRTIVCSFFWTKHRNVTEGWTDRIALAITAVCIASNADALS